MAYVNEEDELQQGKAGGSVLAGSGGAGGSPTQAVGTGFTNLQKYLDANKGSGEGLANDITAQGQKAVDAARTTADTQANTWADTGVQQAGAAADKAAGVYNDASAAFRADPNYDPIGVRQAAYAGPQAAQDVAGFNDLDKAYQNVKNTATGFGNDMATQKAGLQQKYGYGSGFAALDTFLGRQDGKDKIQSWAQGVNPGSAQSQIDRVNTAITGGKQKVTDAQAGFEKANRDAKAARSAADKNANNTNGQGIADKVYDAFADDMDKQNKQTGGYRLTFGG